MNLIQTENIEIDVDQVDLNKYLFLHELLILFEKISDKHARNMGVNSQKIINENNVFWVITKIKLEFKNYPKLYKNYELSTWPQAPSIVKFNRNYQLKDGNNDILNACSEWCLLDVENRKIARSNKISYPDIDKNIQCALSDGFSKFNDLKTKFISNYEYICRYTDIDINKHFNNSKYVMLIENCFSIEEWDLSKLKTIEIHFLNETLYNEKLLIERYKTDNNNYYIEAKNLNKDKITFKAQITFYNKE